MHDRRRLVRDRVDRILRDRLRPAVHRTVAPLTVEAWHGAGEPGDPVPAAVALGRAGTGYLPHPVGQEWGPAWGTTWFHLTGRVPVTAAGRRVELLVDLGWRNVAPGFQAEGLVHRPDGTVVKGLNPRTGWIPVVAEAAGGEHIDVYVEAAANPVVDVWGFTPTEVGDKLTAGNHPLYRLARADIAVLEREVWELVQDLEVLRQLEHELADQEPRAWEVLRALERALDLLDVHDVAGSAPAARAALADVLARPAHASAHRLSAVGHAHIDSAWLWPLRETVRKVARTVANVVDLLDEHPDLVYAMSAAQHFAWLQEHQPAVFARLARHVEAGRFVPVGGMWVEADTNLPGGEALARQFVHGKRYFLDTFGIETEEVWLPDTFGYSAALPQLVRLSGSRWFLTQKLSWNETNAFPHHSFLWEGIDGTRVFTHFPPVDTYLSELSGAELAHAARNFRDKGVATRSLVPFGWGDGGGGPTREMVARARRAADLEGSPTVTMEAPAAFFAAAQREYENPPVWVGELYLELHRGTYTSQAATKRGNRRCEHLLREAELWSTTAAVRGLAAYPYDELDRIWKTVLLHQFHDILPGSSIAWVHREARETYRQVVRELEDIIGTAQRALARGGVPGAGTVVFNGAPHARGGVPSLGARPVPEQSGAVSAERQGDGAVLDNGLLRVVVDGAGLVPSVWDHRARREVVPPGRRGNLLQLHPDLPVRWDAWDVDTSYRARVVDLVGLDDLEVVRSPAPAVRVTRTFGASRVVQTLTLPPGAGRLDVRTEVDWREREKILKVAFPVDVHTDRAAYEIQYGHVHRAIHENTSWDAARFEVCAHRWVHVAEAGYGAALINDCTYGHDLRREANDGGGTSTTVRLSLLRSPRFPDPDTDQGHHVLAYALVPGAGVADAVREGYAINLPERRVPGTAVVEPVVRLDGEGAVVEAVKLADDRSGDVVVRLYECRGGRAAVTLVPGFPAGDVTETDLLEREIAREAVTSDGERGRGVALRLRPFQIVTLRFRRGADGAGKVGR